MTETRSIKDKLSLIDSNILVYAYNTTDKKKHNIAKKLLERCWEKEIKLTISAQNLAEFYVVVTEKVPNPLTIKEAEQIILDITKFSHWIVLHYDSNTLLKAISIQKSKHFWDTLIVATMIENNVFQIYTENIKDFNKFKELTVINPF
ncbi:MAG: PIN domain-containing protein [Nanoarchaeota archaeon]|nr:PIN domain-containing protein [Nanoarchaeota archaeon]